MRSFLNNRRLIAGLVASSSLLAITPAQAAPSSVKATILADNGSLVVLEQSGPPKVIAQSIAGNWPIPKTFTFDIDDTAEAMRVCRVHLIAWGDGSVAQGVMAHFGGDAGVAYTGQAGGPLNNVRMSSVMHGGSTSAGQAFASIDANAAAIIAGAATGSTQFTSQPAVTGGIPGTWGPISLPDVEGRNAVKFLWNERAESLNANPRNYRVLSMPCSSVVKPKPPVASFASWEIAGQFNAANNFAATSNPFEVWSYGYKQAADCKGPLILFTNKTSGTFANRFQDLYSRGPNASNASDLPSIGQSLGATQLTPVAYSPSGLTMHPGPQNQCAVVRFTVPKKGTYRMMGRFWAQNSTSGGTNTGTSVILNNTVVIDPRGVVTLPSGVNNNPFAWSGALNGGDTVDFVVDSNGSFISDSTGLHGYIQRDE